MPSRFFATTVTLGGLLTFSALAWPAHAACVPARKGASVARLPMTWQAAIEQLIRSTAEPGHPWSCTGGTIDLDLSPAGAVLRVAREGEEPVARRVTSPEDVPPLGEALLAMPLALPAAPEPTASPPPATEPAPAPPAPPPVAAAPAPAVVASPGKPAPRLLLGGGVDARGVGGSGVAWVGPFVSAAVPMGRWLPAISLRQQSSVLSGRGPIDEVSVAIALQTRFEVRTVELRAGLALRGATVQRALPDRQGEQGRLEGRVGAIASVMVPVLPWARLVVSGDADGVALSRERRAATTSEEPRRFPTFTVGGSAGIEVPL